MKLNSSAAFLGAATAFALSACDQSDGTLDKPEVKAAAAQDIAAETAAAIDTVDSGTDTTAETTVDTATTADIAPQEATATPSAKPELPDVPWHIHEAIKRALDARNCTNLKFNVIAATHPLSHVFAWGKSTKVVEGLVMCQDGSNKTQRLAQMGEAPSVNVRTLQTVTNGSLPEYSGLQHITDKKGLTVVQSDVLNNNGTFKGKVIKDDLVPKDGDTCEIIHFEHKAGVGDFVEQYRTLAGKCVPLIDDTTAKLGTAWDNGGTKYGINQ